LRLGSINGRNSAGLDGPPWFSLKKGSPVTRVLVNKSLFSRVIHVQGHVVQLLQDSDGGRERGWRDSVIVPPPGARRIAFVADHPGQWLIA
jgi:FtsP/CotA-like multicopper oxidase with cupredoxin domain